MYDINYWAVLVSAIAFFAVGAVWYNDSLFGKAWRASMGKSDAEFQNEKQDVSMGFSFGIMFLGSLIMAFVTAHLVDLIAVAYPMAGNFKLGLMIGFWVWFGYIASYVLSAVAFERRSWKYYFINTGYWLVGTLLMGAILTAWQ